MLTPRPRISRRERQQSLRERSPGGGSILFICTGNVCRSAYAHRALKTHLRAANIPPARIEVSSMGTWPNQALGVPEILQQIGAEHGVEGLADHAPVATATPALRSADLILTATKDHMEQVLRDTPQSLGRTFTLLEFGALVQLMDERTNGEWIAPGMGVRGMARAAARHRALARSALGSLDLEDPFRGPEAGYRQMVALVEPILARLTDVLIRATEPAQPVSGSASAPQPGPR
ncbi:MAG: phosphotyrosine protein phosphatase [Micrococcus sp.]|nr:phosphotyrosine protein phosphatase [Micrococcus sp.]